MGQSNPDDNAFKLEVYADIKHERLYPRQDSLAKEPPQSGAANYHWNTAGDRRNSRPAAGSRILDAAVGPGVISSGFSMGKTRP